MRVTETQPISDDPARSEPCVFAKFCAGTCWEARFYPDNVKGKDVAADLREKLGGDVTAPIDNVKTSQARVALGQTTVAIGVRSCMERCSNIPTVEVSATDGDQKFTRIVKAKTADDVLTAIDAVLRSAESAKKST